MKSLSDSPQFDSSCNKHLWIQERFTIILKDSYYDRPLIWIHDQKLLMYENLSV